MKIRITMLFLLLSLALVLNACATDDQTVLNSTEIPPVIASNDVVVEGNLVPADYLGINIALGGKVEELFVEEGQIVRQGDLLLRLGDRESYEAALSAAELELKNAQQALDDLKENTDLARNAAWLGLIDTEEALIAAETRWDAFEDSTFEDDLEDARLDVIEAKDALDTAQENFEPYADLDEDNTQRIRYEDALEDAEDEYTDMVRARDLLQIEKERERALLEQAQSAYANAQRVYSDLQNGPDPDDLALAEARLGNAKAQQAAAQAAFENLDLIAPMDGTIVEIHISEGERVMPGQNALLLADFSEWYVETSDLTELEVVEIALGQAVVIVPDSIPDLELTGSVESIADVFKERLGDITYTVRILLHKADPRLRWGMTMEVTFEGGDS